jgi:hypothetical protein
VSYSLVEVDWPSSETSVNFYQTTRRILYNRRHGNIKKVHRVIYVILWTELAKVSLKADIVEHGNELFSFTKAGNFWTK